MSDPQKTPLYEIHKDRGGKVIDFGGWWLPVQFSGIIDEVKATRNGAGLFDVSHMGEVLVEGPGALEYLQKMVPNDVSRLKDGKILYTPMCYENGGTVDDFLIYRLKENKFLLIPNAANKDKDYDWLVQHNTEGVQITDCSDDYGQIALQGPNAQKILQKLTDTPLKEIKFFRFKEELDMDGIKGLVSRTGYTGEDGFEIYLQTEDTPKLWEKIEAAGEGEGLQPAGLGARDVLRFEACLPLYGNELSPDITPLEAGLNPFVKLNKEEEFIGKERLLKQKEEGLDRMLVGFEMVDRGIPRHEYKLLKDGEEIGFVSSGSQSPTLGKALGLGFVPPAYRDEGTELEVQIRKKTAKAKVIKTPFYGRG